MHLVFGLGEEIQRCPRTGRAYENGSGALSHEQQTANYLREAVRDDMPLEASAAFKPAANSSAATARQARLLRRKSS
jgi:hypothetical protein